jgi:RNA polymerase sigma-70 factor, ECF subfamily
MHTRLLPPMSLATLPDVALLEQAYAGNQRAFEALVERYQETLYRFAARRVDSDLAHDVLQFVWLQLYRTMSVLLQKSEITQGTSSLKAWLFCVTRNRCMDEIRRKRRYPLLFSDLLPLFNDEEQSLLSDILDSAPLPEELAEQHDDRARLHDAIEALPPKYRLIVWLRYRHELSFNEIGSKLNMSANTVKTYFYRSRLRLGSALSPLRHLS